MNYENQLFATLIKNNIYSFSRDNICDVFLTDSWYSLWFIDFYRKYAWFVPLKVIKDITITKIIQKTLDETNHKPKNVGKWRKWVLQLISENMNSKQQYRNVVST